MNEAERIKDMNELEANIDLNCDENNYPNKSSLVLNALISCLEDENQLIKRLALDFMFSHLKLTNNYLGG
jgi:hypothetical protein